MGITKHRKCFFYLALTALYFVSSALYFAATAVAASHDFKAAGILLVADDHRSALVFLVRHRSRAWYEMPGGRRQTLDDTAVGQGNRSESAYETAIRECFEETRGFLSPELLRGIVDPSRVIRDGGFVFFVAKIGWFPVTELPDLADSGHENPDAFREIADYAWVPVDNVLAGEDASVIDANGRIVEVRRQLKSRLLRARAAGWV